MQLIPQLLEIYEFKYLKKRKKYYLKKQKNKKYKKETTNPKVHAHEKKTILQYMALTFVLEVIQACQCFIMQ